VVVEGAPPVRRYERNAADLASARDIRRTFTDKDPEREQILPWSWPKSMVEVGSCQAVMYASDKWRDDGRLVDYKHVAEGPQTLLVTPGFLREHDAPRSELAVRGIDVDLNGRLPDSFAVLARILGIQAQLFAEAEDGGLYLPNNGENLYQVDIANAWLGGAKHPETGEKFLLIYTKRSGVCCLITGDILDIERDGITG
jgi:hypothetical protein